jgi:hypothetical protein
MSRPCPQQISNLYYSYGGKKSTILNFNSYVFLLLNLLDGFFRVLQIFLLGIHGRINMPANIYNKKGNYYVVYYDYITERKKIFNAIIFSKMNKVLKKIII